MNACYHTVAVGVAMVDRCYLIFQPKVLPEGAVAVQEVNMFSIDNTSPDA
jgi:hypothetical protein